MNTINESNDSNETNKTGSIAGFILAYPVYTHTH